MHSVASAGWVRFHAGSAKNGAPTNIASAGSTTIQVTATNDGITQTRNLQLGLTVPAGWQAQLATAAGTTLAPGASTTATWSVTAPASTAPISSATITATSSYTWLGKTQTSQSSLPLTVVDPVQAPLRTASIGGAGGVFGQMGSGFAIQAAGAVSTSADEYGTIYEPGAVTGDSTVEATVTGQPGAVRGAKAGIVIRNDLSGASGSPEGVLLYLSNGRGGTTVQMAWNTGSGADVTNTSPSSSPVAGAVTLQLVDQSGTYTGSYSTDGGSTWTQVGSPVTLGAPQAATQDAGMFQASGSATPAEADFSGFTVS